MNIIRSARKMLWLFGIIVSAGSLASADTTLADYARRLKDTQLHLESVRQHEDGETPPAYASRRAGALAFARRTLPESETIQGPDGPLKVENKWLAEELQQYEELEPGSPEADRQLESIAARLSALRSRLDELPRSASGPSKEEQKGKLDSILRRPEYNEQTKDNALTRWAEAIREFFRTLLGRSAAPLNGEQAKKAAPVTQIIVYSLIALVLLFAARRIIPFLKLRRSSNQALQQKTGARIILGEKLEAHQTSADIFDEAEQLARNGEFRLAMRKGYIALLCALGDNKSLRLEQHKTNCDYLREVAGQSALYRPLQFLTNRFEYHWYGLAPASQQDWDEFRARYERVKNS